MLPRFRYIKGVRGRAIDLNNLENRPAPATKFSAPSSDLVSATSASRKYAKVTRPSQLVRRKRVLASGQNTEVEGVANGAELT